MVGELGGDGSVSSLGASSSLGIIILMQLEDNDIRDFKELWRTEFGETLSTEEARHHASQLLALYELLATPPNAPGSTSSTDHLLTSP